MRWKIILTGWVLVLSVMNTVAQVAFESAKDAVANMRIGWNLGNTLDSNSGETNNMWIEAWSSRTPKDYETAWGQPQATRELIHMFKEAGFNAIRVPVTWYPHYGTLNNVSTRWDQSKWTGYTLNSTWLNRVKQVVGYVLDEGMYCILNVHHDTGTHSAAWIRADEENYEAYSERYEKLWTALANSFKDYDEHLLFEGYNEMTDKYGSWCYASFNAPNGYSMKDANAAYNAVNSYAQSFVTAVRATGGNNATRNLIVNTYAACDGHGTWSSHLLDPLKNMKLPADDTEGHLIFQVHSYWDTNNYNSTMRSEITSMFANLSTYLGKNAPVIIGEWGGSSEKFDYANETMRNKLVDFANYFIQKAKAKNMSTFYWMGLSDAKDRSVPKWSQPELLDAIVKGYYGEYGYVDAIPSAKDRPHNSESYTLSGISAPASSQGIVIKNGKKVLSGR